MVALLTRPDFGKYLRPVARRLVFLCYVGASTSGVAPLALGVLRVALVTNVLDLTIRTDEELNASSYRDLSPTAGFAYELLAALVSRVCLDLGLQRSCAAPP